MLREYKYPKYKYFSFNKHSGDSKDSGGSYINMLLRYPLE